MSWPLAAFGILGIGLLAGFAWYERTRPDARMVALVGTLAAFAALGRIAFVAVPNVKPTSDIVLISGFALGGAPGYVVGAVAALASNFFFGQGPWTPWQMAGWGLTGLAGAGLARLTRRRIGRLPLALVSFGLGFAFTALQDVGDWVTYSDHSLAQLSVYVGKGVGFDLVHAVGCFGFAMLFGPGLLRTLARFRARTQITWLAPAARTEGAGGTVLTLALAAAVLVAGSAAPAARAARGPTGRAVAGRGHGSPVRYLLRAENPDGGFGPAPGERSDPMTSGWATLALREAGWPARAAVAYVLRTQRSGDHNAGDVERTLLAAGPAGGPVLTRALRHMVGRDGSVGGQTNLTSFAILALRGSGAGVPVRMYRWLTAQQDGDGGFNYARGGGVSDVDDTGAALAAIATAPAAIAGTRAVSRARSAALRYLRGQQNRDGGFPATPGAGSNAQSTAFAVCGLIAAGLNPAHLRRGRSRSPLAYLRGSIQPDGAVDYSRANPQTPVWVTAQAEIALAGKAL